MLNLSQKKFTDGSTACRTLSTAQKLASGFSRTRTISLDVSNQAELDAEVSTHQLAISLIPYTYHVLVIKSAIKAKINVVTTSYVSPAMRELESAVKEAGIVVMNEVGVDPGVDHLYAIKTIGEVHEKGGKVSSIRTT
jgi:saccharopine dehydrogenase-like NADP-dependent oxidoreductase